MIPEPTTPPPAPEKPVTLAPEKPAAPPTMTLPSAEVEALRSRLAAYEASEAEAKAATEAKERDRLKAIAEKAESQKAIAELEGRYKQDVAEREERYAALRTRWESKERSVAVAHATTGVRWASEYAGRDALAKLESRLEVVETEGGTVVRDRVTGRPAADVVKELLASPEYAHYQAPGSTSKGGLGGGNTPAPTAATGGNAAEPRNLGEYLAAQFLARRDAAAASDPYGPPGLAGRRH